MQPAAYRRTRNSQIGELEPASPNWRRLSFNSCMIGGSACWAGEGAGHRDQGSTGPQTLVETAGMARRDKEWISHPGNAAISEVEIWVSAARQLFITTEVLGGM